MYDATTPPTDTAWEDVDDVSWTLLDLDEIVDAYSTVVARSWRLTVLIPTTKSRFTAGSVSTICAPFSTRCESITTRRSPSSGPTMLALQRMTQNMAGR